MKIEFTNDVTLECTKGQRVTLTDEMAMKLVALGVAVPVGEHPLEKAVVNAELETRHAGR